MRRTSYTERDIKPILQMRCNHQLHAGLPQQSPTPLSSPGFSCQPEEYGLFPFRLWSATIGPVFYLRIVPERYFCIYMYGVAMLVRSITGTDGAQAGRHWGCCSSFLPLPLPGSRNTIAYKLASPTGELALAPLPWSNWWHANADTDRRDWTGQVPRDGWQTRWSGLRQAAMYSIRH